VLLSVFKQKEDQTECNFFIAVKPPEHGINVTEQLFRTKIRKKVVDEDIQFGFRAEKGSTMQSLL